MSTYALGLGPVKPNLVMLPWIDTNAALTPSDFVAVIRVSSHSSSLGFARLCSSSLGFARLCSALLGFARLCSALLGFARFCGPWTTSYLRVFFRLT